MALYLTCVVGIFHSYCCAQCIHIHGKKNNVGKVPLTAGMPYGKDPCSKKLKKNSMLVSFPATQVGAVYLILIYLSDEIWFFCYRRFSV